MKATVDVIVDRDDDIATAKAIRALAAREPGVLAVSIVPGVRSETEVIWAILRALGKRVDQLTNNKVWWIDASSRFLGLTPASRARTSPTRTTRQRCRRRSTRTSRRRSDRFCTAATGI